MAKYRTIQVSPEEYEEIDKAAKQKSEEDLLTKPLAPRQFVLFLLNFWREKR